MKNKDTNSLSFLYEKKIVTKSVLNEEVPPITADEPLGPAKLGEIGAIASDPENVPAFRKEAPSYKGVPRLTMELTRNAIYATGVEILKKLQNYPDGVYPHSKKEFVPEVIIPAMKAVIPAGVFRDSWYKYIAGQAFDVLKQVKAIREFGGGMRVGRQPRDLDRIVNNLEIKIPDVPAGDAGGAPPKI